jgi:hypothetical protein
MRIWYICEHTGIKNKRHYSLFSPVQISSTIGEKALMTRANDAADARRPQALGLFLVGIQDCGMSNATVRLGEMSVIISGARGFAYLLSSAFCMLCNVSIVLCTFN